MGGEPSKKGGFYKENLMEFADASYGKEGRLLAMAEHPYGKGGAPDAFYGKCGKVGKLGKSRSCRGKGAACEEGAVQVWTGQEDVISTGQRGLGSAQSDQYMVHAQDA